MWPSSVCERHVKMVEMMLLHEAASAEESFCKFAYALIYASGNGSSMQLSQVMGPWSISSCRTCAHTYTYAYAYAYTYIYINMSVCMYMCVYIIYVIHTKKHQAVPNPQELSLAR